MFNSILVTFFELQITVEMYKIIQYSASNLFRTSLVSFRVCIFQLSTVHLNHAYTHYSFYRNM